MQQPCPRCGFVSDRPTRFCRQCGTPMFTETETTSAQTRNYEPRQTDQPFATSQLHTGGGSGAPTQETIRFYQPPAAPAANYPSYPEAPPRKSRAGMWILIAFLSLLLVGGGMIGMVSYALRSRPPADHAPLPEDFGDQIREQVERQIEKQIQHALEEAEKAQRAAEKDSPGYGPPPPPPPAPPLPPSESAVALEKYKYPNATLTPMPGILANEILRMRTEDDLDQVRDFYQKLLGEPLDRSGKNSENKLVFQSPETPSVVVIVQQHKTDKEQLQILVIRSRFPIPKVNQKQ